MVTASLVVGADGSTTLNGTSRGLSTIHDREVFLAYRRTVDCIIVGGKTAASEPYKHTPVPLVVLSRTVPPVLSINPVAHWWKLSPVEAIARARKEYGENIAIEGGGSLIQNLLEAGCIDELRLSITPKSCGENKIEISQLTKYFAKTSEPQIIGVTKFIICTEPTMNPK